MTAYLGAPWWLWLMGTVVVLVLCFFAYTLYLDAVETSRAADRRRASYVDRFLS